MSGWPLGGPHTQDMLTGWLADWLTGRMADLPGHGTLLPLSLCT